MAEVSVFKPLAFTKLGLMLEAKLRTGVPLQLTRVKIGDGTLEEGESPLDITELKHEITSHQTGTEGTGATVDMSNFKVLEAGITDLRVIVESNDSDFVLRELAIMAQDPDVGEIPYLYTYGGTDAFKSGVTVRRTYNFTDIITNATDIQVNTTVVDGAPLEDFEAHKEQIASITDFGHIKLYSKGGVNTSGLLINEDGTLVVNIDNRHGLYRSGAGQITVAAASEEDILKRTDEYKPIVPARLGYIFGNAALTGTPTAPTADTSTNNEQIATTAFVQNSFGNNLIAYLVSRKMSFTATATVNITNQGNTVKVNSVEIRSEFGTPIPVEYDSEFDVGGISGVNSIAHFKYDAKKKVIIFDIGIAASAKPDYEVYISNGHADYLGGTHPLTFAPYSAEA